METLIVYEDLDVMRYEIKNPTTGGTLQSPVSHCFSCCGCKRCWYSLLDVPNCKPACAVGASAVVTIAYYTPDQEKDRSLFTDPETGVDMEVVDQVRKSLARLLCEGNVCVVVPRCPAANVVTARFLETRLPPSP